MEIERKLSKLGKGAKIADAINWKTVDAKITDSNGKTIFQHNGVEVPEHWSQNATNILAQKYFRKAGVPGTGGEHSAKQVFNRLAGCWAYWGREMGLFDSQQASAFYDEIYYCLAHQIAAPNSPQWFNTGLHWAYDIEGPPSGQWAVIDGNTVQMEHSYVRPQPHACFIQPVNDDLVNPGGIMDLWTKEVRLFKHGSGTGSNFSRIRAKGELLSGGGISSGLMSFLEIGDKAAGAIKSGGTTRRAAKMVVVDADHPEVEDFITWKVREERKAKAMALGSQQLSVMDQGETFSDSWEGEAIRTVSGQNSNNSVRVVDAFMDHVTDEHPWPWKLYARTDGSTMKLTSVQNIWNLICHSAHQCGDPGLQFHDTTNKWHTCATDGPINASNPCSEYLFLDNTACNLASINLVAALEPDFDVHRFQHIVKLWTIVLEISVEMASFPSAEIALNSYNYRTLGLGYANLGALIMRQGLSYDSSKGRALASSITSLMTATAYKTSNWMARDLGPFPRYEANKVPMSVVLVEHATASRKLHLAYPSLLDAANKTWDSLDFDIGFRNAQVTLIAPTGTISFVMDCDTTGIEPDLSLVKYKNLAGGGTMKIVNNSVEPALHAIGIRNREDIDSITKHLLTTGNIETAGIDKHYLPIFDCAFKPPGGQRSLTPMAHIKMCEAVQPFLSGGISKTINMPEEATVADVSEAYIQAWKRGLKSVSIYRDNSKLAQPMSTGPGTAVTVTNGSGNGRHEREYLSPRRHGYTQKLKVDGQTLYLRTGEYDDGRLGEIFLTLSREGSTVRSIMESFAKSISIGLQYGVPLDEYIEAFIHTRFEPAGIVEGHDTIKMCSSIVDLVFRDLGTTYLNQNLGQITNPVPTHVSRPSGEICICGTEMIRTGTCLSCPNCGANFGCG